MSHAIYRPYPRHKNQALIQSLVHPTGKNAMFEACTVHRQDFSPSLYLELDWQRFRPDLADRDHQQILDFIHNLLFIIGFPNNLTARDQGLGGISLSRAEATTLAPIYAAWQDTWMAPEGQRVLDAFDRFVAGLRTAPRREVEVQARVTTLQRLDEALATLTDARSLAAVVDQVLSNALFAFLDIPWTRRPIRALLVHNSQPGGFISVVPASLRSAKEPRALSVHLRGHADKALAPGTEEWAALLRAAADRIDAVDPMRLRGDDGEWTASFGPCGRCAMWFASRTAAALDDQVSYAQRLGNNIVYLPQHLMVSRCPFCGFLAPNNVPALFFSEARGQVVYLAPTQGSMPADQAIAFWTPAIVDLQKRYLARRGGAASERFRAAPELVTHDVVGFFYAVQMGETIAEDHVFNLVGLADGSALIFDGEKRFARVVTPVEAQMLRSQYRTEPCPPVDAKPAAKPGRLLTLEEVDGLLRDMAMANDDFSARLAGLKTASAS